MLFNALFEQINEKVTRTFIRIRKVRELSYLDEKYMSIIAIRLNGSLFQDIYFGIYIVSTCTRLPYFRVLEY